MRLLAAAVVLCSPSTGHSAASDALITRAHARDLAADPYWLVLGHYYRSPLGRWISRVDGPRFFLAADGKHDPAAELDATLRRLADPETAADTACRFPARLAWLHERLDLGADDLPASNCPDFEAVWQEIQPESVSLVFPSAYMNSPASLFGHTLLSIKSRFDSRLLDKAVNYAATGTDTNGILFAVKGIFGLYDAYYHVTPYYEKVQQYNHIDQRDIWEYQLNLTEKEIRRLLLHVWEFREVPANYFFFDENCSYTLLFLLDAARPGLELCRRTRPWVIPLDTIRLVSDAGMVESVHWRPSRATRVRRLAASVPPESAELALRLSRGTRPAAAVGEHTGDRAAAARILDLASEYLQGERAKGRVSKADYVPRFLGILKQRSALGMVDELDLGTAPEAPDRGHGSMRLALLGGAAWGTSFVGLRYRPAYHDLLDPAVGYPAGSEISFLDTEVHLADDGSITCPSADLLTIRSLSPRDRFYQPRSWLVSLGYRQDYGRGDDERHYFRLHGGGGYTWRAGDRGLYWLTWLGEFRAGDLHRAWSLGAGGATGLLLPLGRRYAAMLTAQALQFGGGEALPEWECGFEHRWQYRPNLMLRHRIAVLGRNRDATLNTTLGLEVFF